MFVVKYRDVSIVHSNEVVNVIVQIPPWYTMHLVNKCHFKSHSYPVFDVIGYFNFSSRYGQGYSFQFQVKSYNSYWTYTVVHNNLCSF